MATDNSVIEQKIEKEEAEAEAIRKAMYESEPVGEVAGGDNPASSVTETKDDKDTKDLDEKPQDSTDTPAEVIDTEQREDPKPDAKEEESYKAKYLTLKGKFDKELPASAKALKAAKAEVAQWREYTESLEAKIQTLDAALKAGVKDEKKETAATPVIDISDPEVQTMLGDYPGMAKLLASLEKERQADKKLIEELQTTVDSKLKTIETETEVSKVDRFDQDMVTLVGSDWRKTDSDPGFLEFLSEDVPYTGKTRLDLLREASAKRNASTVAQFFNDYKASLATSEEAAEEAEVIRDESSDDKMKKFVAPPRSGVGTSPKKGVQEQTYTREQYEKFMDDSTRGRYKAKEWGGKTEAEMDAIFDKAISAHMLR